MTQHRKHLSRCVLLVLGALLVVTLSAATVAAQAPVKIRVGYITDTQLTTLMPLKPEILKNYNKSYALDLILTRGSSANIQILASKEIDFTYMSVAATSNAVLKANLDIKIVWSDFVDGEKGWFSIPYAVLETSPVKSVADLRGKTLGILGYGTAIHSALRLMMQRNGMEEKRDYQVVEVSLPSMGAMLRDGKIAMGTFASNFWAFENRKTPKLRTIFSTADSIGRSEYLFYVGRTEFWNQHPQVMKDFMDDYVRTLRWALDPKNREEVLTLRAKLMKRPLQAYTGWAMLPEKDVYRHPDGLVEVASLQKNVDLLAKQGFISSSFDIGKYVDLSHVKAAVERVGK